MMDRSPTRQLRTTWLVIGAAAAAAAITASTWWPLHLVPALVRVPRNAVRAADLDPASRGGVVLIVGVDDRSAVDDAAFGGFRGVHADAIALVADRRGTTTVLRVPRDTRAVLPGYGAQRLGAFRDYGAPTLVRAVRSVVGVPIVHYVEVDMAAVVAAVDAVGGLPIRLRHDARDHVTGFAASAGVARLDGQGALAFARSRQLQIRRGGTWLPAGGDDRRRIARQHHVAGALLTRLATDRGRTRDLVRAVDGHVSVDASMDLQAAAAVARMFLTPRWDVTTLRTRRVVPRDESLSPFPPPRWGAGATLVPTAGAVDDAVRRLGTAVGGAP